MRALLGGLRPGRMMLFTELCHRYESQMREQGRTPASRQGLARALTRVGCERIRVRKSRGPRGKQRVRQMHCWIVPGALPFSPEDDQMCTALRELLGEREHGYIYNEYIWETYQVVNRRHGRNSMSRAQVTRWLNDHRFLEQKTGGKVGPGGWTGIPSRYVYRAKIDRIVPPVINGQQKNGDLT
jgi:hypothetical protein